MVVRPSAFTGSFADDSTKKTQWKAFLRKSRLENAPEKLEEVTSALASFLMPVTEALISGGTLRKCWKAPGPWRTI